MLTGLRKLGHQASAGLVAAVAAVAVKTQAATADATLRQAASTMVACLQISLSEHTGMLAGAAERAAYQARVSSHQSCP